METSVKVEIFKNISNSKLIIQPCENNLKSVISAIQAVRTETNAYLTELVESEKASNGAFVIKDAEKEGEEVSDESLKEGNKRHSKQWCSAKKKK